MFSPRALRWSMTQAGGGFLRVGTSTTVGSVIMPVSTQVVALDADGLGVTLEAFR